MNETPQRQQRKVLERVPPEQLEDEENQHRPAADTRRRPLVIHIRAWLALIGKCLDEVLSNHKK